MRLREAGENSTTIYLYGAYIDTRVENVTVRVLVNSFDYLDKEGMNKPKFCQLWYSGMDRPVISEIILINYIWHDGWGHNGYYHPFLISCALPRTHDKKILKPEEIPESVSLVEDRCDWATHDIKINYDVPGGPKEDFGICIRGLDFPADDISQRIIEWIEIMGLLGVSRIHFHVMDVHPNVSKVLDYYKKNGRVTVKPFQLPGYQPNFPIMRNNYIYYGPNIGSKTWRQEVTAYNDCLYTYMYHYKYIAIMDIDEVFLSYKSRTWKELVQELNVSESPSLCFEMILFVDKIVEHNGPIVYATAPNITNQVQGYPYMMNKLNYEVATVCNGGGTRGYKCLHNTENIYMLHNHWPRACLKDPCSHGVSHDIAYTHHHKDSCWKDGHNESLLPQPFGYDPTILRYKDDLILRRNQVLKEIPF